MSVQGLDDVECENCGCYGSSNFYCGSCVNKKIKKALAVKQAEVLKMFEGRLKQQIYEKLIEFGEYDGNDAEAGYRCFTEDIIELCKKRLLAKSKGGKDMKKELWMNKKSNPNKQVWMNNGGKKDVTKKKRETGLPLFKEVNG